MQWLISSMAVVFCCTVSMESLAGSLTRLCPLLLFFFSCLTAAHPHSLCDIPCTSHSLMAATWRRHMICWGGITVLRGHDHRGRPLYLLGALVSAGCLKRACVGCVELQYIACLFAVTVGLVKHCYRRGELRHCGASD